MDKGVLDVGQDVDRARGTVVQGLRELDLLAPLQDRQDRERVRRPLLLLSCSSGWKEATEIPSRPVHLRSDPGAQRLPSVQTVLAQ